MIKSIINKYLLITCQKLNTTLIFLLIVIINFSSLTAAEENDITDWKLVKNNNDIKAYVEEGPLSDIKSVKVETVVIANLSQLVSIIKDAESHSDWVYMNEEAAILEINDCCHWKYYGRTDVPWPATDRDCVIQTTLRQDSLDYSVTISGNAISGYKDKEEDCVRIQKSHSIWTLNPLGNDMVHVSFELKVDVGGNIPNWLVNMAVSKGPFKTMTAFKEIVNSGKYESSKLNYIKEYPH